MADLSDKDSTLLVRLVGADASGIETNFIDASINGVKVDGSAVTQPISALSLPLPTGASTSANQVTANASLASIDSKLTSPLVVSQTTAANLNAQVVGNVASAATDAGNPLKIGAIFSTTLPTVTNGQRVNAHANNRGELLVSSQGAYTRIAGAATVVVKSGAGILKRIAINRPTNGTATVYDNTTGAGTIIALIGATNGTAPTSLEYGLSFTTGLTIVTTGANLDITVVYL
jgi:hypothetical protein